MGGPVKIPIIEGACIVEVPDADLRLLCGAPENIHKHLVAAGYIRQIEAGDQKWERGPNAILLSETAMAAGHFRNLVEFPVLQMLYRQGMIVPGHPNNSGRRPLLVGLRAQVEALAEYVLLGNYGLLDATEIAGGGVSAADAKAFLALKRRFAFGSFRKTDELLDLRPIDARILDLGGGVFIRRLGNNNYEIIHGGSSVTIGMGATSPPPPPYELGRHSIRRGGFSIVHIGEGDGWDPGRPCMSSIIQTDGEFWLVDAGPNIEDSLAAFGLAVEDLRGLFQTHVHDDHFVGLTALMKGQRRLEYCAIPCVRKTAARKLAALADISVEDFARYFEVHDLESGAWNDFGTFEVRPDFSPHPVENSILRFRAGSSPDCKTYAHLADLTSFRVLDSFTKAGAGGIPLSPAQSESWKALYLEAADVKKIDAGGGMIHGDAADFASDPSPLLYISHRSPPDSERLVGRGRVASFGAIDLLVSGSAPDFTALASSLLCSHFPVLSKAKAAAVAEESLREGGPRAFEAGSLVLSHGRVVTDIVLVLEGAIDFSPADSGPPSRIIAGGIAGKREFFDGVVPSGEYRARHGLIAVRIAGRELFVDFERSLRREGIEQRTLIALTLEKSPLFAGLFGSVLIDQAISFADVVRLGPGEVCVGGDAFVLVVMEGRLELSASGRAFEAIGPGGVYGEECVSSGSAGFFEARASGPLAAIRIPHGIIEEHPVLLWRLKELFERRLAETRAVFDFSWRPEFDMGFSTIDRQHRSLFSAIERAYATIEEGRPVSEEDIERMVAVARAHFAHEEALMEEARFPGLEEHRRAHTLLLAELTGMLRGSEGAIDVGQFMKDCLIRHTLVMDRRYAPFVRSAKLE